LMPSRKVGKSLVEFEISEKNQKSLITQIMKGLQRLEKERGEVSRSSQYKVGKGAHDEIEGDGKKAKGH